MAFGPLHSIGGLAVTPTPNAYFFAITNQCASVMPSSSGWCLGPLSLPVRQPCYCRVSTGVARHVWGTKAKPLALEPADGFAVSGQLVTVWVAKKRNNPSALSLTVTRRVRPPSPSPSITRRRTPAALAVGVHSFEGRRSPTGSSAHSLSPAPHASRRNHAVRLGSLDVSPRLP